MFFNNHKILYVLDRGLSIDIGLLTVVKDKKNIKLAENFIVKVIQQYIASSENFRIGLLSFSNGILKINKKLGELFSHDLLLHLIKQSFSYSGTPLNLTSEVSAVKELFTIDNGEKKNMKQLFFLISDEDLSISAEQYQQILDSGVQLFIIAFEKNFNMLWENSSGLYSNIFLMKEDPSQVIESVSDSIELGKTIVCVFIITFTKDKKSWLL